MKRAIVCLIGIAILPGPIQARSAQLATFKEVCSTITSITVPRYPPGVEASAQTEAVRVGMKAFQDGSVAAIALEGSTAVAAAAVDAAKQWRFAPLPKPEFYPLRFIVSFQFRPSATELELSSDGDTLVVVVPKPGHTGGSIVTGAGILPWFAAKTEFAPYPRQARELRIEGTVVVAVEVDANGTVTAATAESGPVDLRRASERAARDWRFKPVTVDGRLVGIRGRLTFNFKMGS